MAVEQFLPEDLLSDILNRVPLKTVLRCTSVCKLWYSFITSPCFIKTHALSNISEKQVLVWCRFDYGDKFFIHKDDDTFDRISCFDSPFHNTISRLVSSCNGLICICTYRRRVGNQNVFLWNPSIQRYYLLPCSITLGTIGFGYACATNDYKVVNVSTIETGRTSIFQLSTRSWRNLDNCKDFLRNYDIPVDASQCSLKDTIHWVGCELISGDFPLTIITFNMKNEEFGVLQVPSDVIDERPSHVRVILFQDSLALVRIGRGYFDDSCLWVMNEYGVYDSWTKHFTLDLEFGYYNKLLGFKHNGDLLLAQGTIPILVSYDPIFKDFETLSGREADRNGTCASDIQPTDILYAEPGFAREEAMIVRSFFPAV